MVAIRINRFVDPMEAESRPNLLRGDYCQTPNATADNVRGGPRGRLLPCAHDQDRLMPDRDFSPSAALV
jgi:hypothetical protein